MTTKIKDLVVSMVREEIETKPKYKPCRRELTFYNIVNSCYGILCFQVYFRFKPIGRGKKNNIIRFDVSLDNLMNEHIVFVYTTFERA